MMRTFIKFVPRRGIWAGVAIPLSFLLARIDLEWTVLWPSCIALLLVFITRSALAGLLSGALCGAILLSDGSLSGVIPQLFLEQFMPILHSEWKLSAMLFTLILGGFVALVEAGGGLQGLLKILLGNGRAPAKRMQYTVLGFGCLVFFDGLANTMLLGRLLRSAADRCGVSRAKLAYLADATGSAVACLAFVSTWIAFQLSMIREGFALAGAEVSAYALFFRSLPTNFYCLFALVLVVVSIRREFNPGPMGSFERSARGQGSAAPPDSPEDQWSPSHWLMAIIPIAVLTLSIPLFTYLIGAESGWPFSLKKFAEAYAAAESLVPRILVVSSILASLVAAIAWLQKSRFSKSAAAQTAPIFFSGVRDLLVPVLVLVAAWMLGSAIGQLGAADLLASLLQGRLPPGLLPVSIFGLGALISFSTGTSWGTMGVLMPLAIPVIFALTGESLDAERDRLVVAAIGAVFSGAVFGDHCSPFSDTTIVASIATDIAPLEHVRTQLPFALLTALVAGVFGFLPLGYGISPWLCLPAGAVFLYILPSVLPSFLPPFESIP